MGTKDKSLNKWGLTELEEAFCHIFLACNNQGKTYLRLKPKVTTASAYELGSRMLRKVEVANRVEELRKKQMERYKITADKVLHETALIAFQNIDDYGEWDEDGNLLLEPSSELPRHLKGVIKSIEKVTKEIPTKNGEPIIVNRLKLTLYSKEKALEMLGRHLGLFQDSSGPPVVVNFNIQNFERPRPVQYQEIEND